MSEYHSYKLLRIYVAKVLKSMGLQNTKLSVLNIMTEVLEERIKTLAEETNYCAGALGCNQPELAHLLFTLERRGIHLEELMQYCLLINSSPQQENCKPGSSSEPLDDVQQLDSEELQKPSACENDDSLITQEFKKCKTVQDFLMLKKVCTMAAKDIKKTLKIKTD